VTLFVVKAETFPLMTPRYLVKSVETADSIKHLPILQDLLHETYRYKVHPSSTKSIRTRPRKGFRFDDEQCHANITLSEDKLKSTLKTPVGWVNVRCVQALSPQNPYIEFKVEVGAANQLMIGVVQGTCATTGYAGQWANGWTYYSSGQVYNASGTPATGQLYQSPDTIGVYFDFKTNQLSFYRNGLISTSVPNISVAGGALYPIVCMNTAGNCVSVIPHAPLPKDIKIEAAPKDAKKGRSKLTASSLERTYAGSEELGGLLLGDVDEVEPEEPLDGSSFIRRFLQFKF